MIMQLEPPTRTTPITAGGRCVWRGRFEAGDRLTVHFQEEVVGDLELRALDRYGILIADLHAGTPRAFTVYGACTLTLEARNHGDEKGRIDIRVNGARLAPEWVVSASEE